MDKKTIQGLGRGAVCACQPSRTAVPVPVRLLDVGRLWRREMLGHEVEHWTVAADTRCQEDPDQRWRVGYLAVTVRADAGNVPARAAADLAALTLPTLPVEPGDAMSMLAHVDRALPPHMTLTIVNSRHLTGRWSGSGARSTSQPQQEQQGEGGGRLTERALAAQLADPAAPLIAGALRLLDGTALQALAEASTRTARQVWADRIIERVRTLIAEERPAPGEPVVCAYFRPVHGDRITWHPVIAALSAGEDTPDLRYRATSATPIKPRRQDEPPADSELVEALNALAALDKPADGQVLRVHLVHHTVTHVTA